MPEPDDLITAFSPQPGRCFRMVQSRQLQATHCRQEPVWKGQWRDVKGRSWYVEACREHAPKMNSDPSEGFGVREPSAGPAGLAAARRHINWGQA